MDAIRINFKVTPPQKTTIELRATENGFDTVSSYLKVVAIKTQQFSITYQEPETEEASEELEFEVTKVQKEKIEANIKASDCKDLATYLQFVALHGVVTAVIEVRSTGNLNTMLERIAKSRNIKLNN
ncbi:hypothetical protein JHD48_01880 [Sulfurimonas sp. SAG-AH-194-I05]|nr:hypothetical protein [Sulfurimonas sp. SAG-AH-194-I05]MDF1874478.1 hypothetical protein [Sulfurimonas sp. SAG-AH-194-I05]